ncbi:MAG: nitrate transporter [Nevskia sp.]|nr:nitrate transporter [Nevskia sp.]
MSLPEQTRIRLGILPLADALPLVIALKKGFFEKHHLKVELSVERAWAAVRDKVSTGLLDGAQMLAPMPIAAALGIDGVGVPMITAMGLNLNGNAITVSHGLYERMCSVGIDVRGPAGSASALAQLIRVDRAAGRPPLVFAHVFPFSTHHYELRMWLASAGIDPDGDVLLRVVPPPRMVEELESGRIDGFCVGAPWSDVAAESGSGVVVASKHQIWNNSPEKVLAVTRAWADANPQTLRRLVAALIEAARWLDVPAHRREAAYLMIGGGWLQAKESALQAALTMRPDGLLFHRYAATFPWRSHAVWFILQMLRAGQCKDVGNPMALAEEIYRCDVYREAAALVGEPCPDADVKLEGNQSGTWAMPSTGNVPLELGANLLLDGSIFRSEESLPTFVARRQPSIHLAE